jgi:hypothetical protein
MKPTKETMLQKARGHSDDPRYQDSWITGAAWGIAQMSNLYTEEEVLELLVSFHFLDENVYEWFNSNKKKL